MNQYLVVLSIGPVQSMIAAARRSRDLWSGSWLLSELAKSCAKSLNEQGANLIFPYVDNASLLQMNSDFSVGNKLQVVIGANNTDELIRIINQAKKATQARFLYEADAAIKQLDHAKDDIRQEVWDTQKTNYLEIQAAWAKIDTSDHDGYKQAIQKASGALAARKATRDFVPAATDPYDMTRMLPKSSLDGAYETILNKPHNKLKTKTRTKLSLSDSEQLDCLGTIKRLGFADTVEQFTPFTRVTAHAWIDRLTDDELRDINTAYAKLVKHGVATNVKGNKGDDNQSIYHKLPFDAQMLYPSRIDAEILQIERAIDIEGDPDLLQAREALKDLRDSTLKNVWQRIGQPYSYGVMLLADGDRMGELLDKATSLDEHQKITKALSDFAESVADTMRIYNGHCIYAGGDDVLGFVPLDQAYDCSKRLSDDFNNRLLDVSASLGVDKSPTLSVGLAVCHIMTPMSVIRDLANQAEKYAKGDHIKDDISKRRNALSLLLSVRSGTDIQVRYQWDDRPSLETFQQWIKMYVDKAIPSRVAYDIRDIHLRTDLIARHEPELRKGIRSAELKRMLEQARTATGEKIATETIEQLQERGTAIGLDKLADELIVARWFAAKTQQELGKE
ncbi:type III-B CRISPR-associated protein Cas10/Cmr2 [Psychrobacter piscatorii]|uniref:type III-B CRISPR-associated protein Cas10/Cmr2 n=1 Tax=Psychrobacter piscatorii TaxID=554343 RepID=UPI003735CD98